MCHIGIHSIDTRCPGSIDMLLDSLQFSPMRLCLPRRTFEYTVVSYFLLPTALLRVPLLGSLVAFPGAALGAFCLADILSKQPALRQAFDHLQ